MVLGRVGGKSGVCGDYCYQVIGIILKNTKNKKKIEEWVPLKWEFGNDLSGRC